MRPGTTSMIFPSGLGGHNWHPMAYSPDTGLMYIPTLEFGTEFEAEEAFEFTPRHWNLGYKADGADLNQQLTQAILKTMPRSFLMAWDPVKQQAAWRADYPYGPNGGVLATAGNLVFQGSVDGYFYAYRADTGERLWQADVQNGVMAAPISYQVGGENYVTVMVGRGGGFSLMIGIQHDRPVINGRVITFKLGASESLPAIPKKQFPEPPDAAGYQR